MKVHLNWNLWNDIGGEPNKFYMRKIKGPPIFRKGLNIVCPFVANCVIASYEIIWRAEE